MNAPPESYQNPDPRFVHSLGDAFRFVPAPNMLDQAIMDEARKYYEDEKKRGKRYWSEPFAPIHDYFEPYNEAGRSSVTGFFIACAYTIIIVFTFLLLLASKPWGGPEEQFDAFGLLRQAPDLLAGQANPYASLPCSAGLFGAHNGSCSVRLSRSSPVEQALFVKTADPCTSAVQYFSGAWTGDRDSSIVSRFFDSASIYSSKLSQIADERDALQYSNSESSTMGIAARGAGGVFHDIVMSCINNFGATNANVSGDIEFTKSVMRQIHDQELIGHRSKLYQAAYALGVTQEWGVSTVVKFDDTVNPRRTSESLLDWDVGTMVRMYSKVGNDRMRDFFEDSCRALQYIGFMPESIYTTYVQCGEDAFSLYLDFVREATVTETEVVDFDFWTIETRFETYDQAKEHYGPDFVDGFLDAVTAGFEDYREFFNERRLDVPTLRGIKHLVERPNYLQFVSSKASDVSTARWVNFLRVMMMVDGMQYTSTLLTMQGDESSSGTNSINSTTGQAPLPPPLDPGTHNLQSQVFMHWPTLEMKHTAHEARTGHAVGQLGAPRLHDPSSAHRRQQIGFLPGLPVWRFLNGHGGRGGHVGQKNAKKVEEPKEDGFLRSEVDSLTDLMSSKLWERCTMYATQNLPVYTDRTYRSMAMTDKQRQRVTDMAQRINVALMDLVTQSQILSVETKSNMVKKLDEMKLIVGAPDYNESYELPFLSIGKDRTLLENAYHLNSRWNRQRFFEAASLNGISTNARPTTALEMPTHVPNAYYSPGENKFYILCGISSQPIVHDEWSDAAVYGMLGAVIGHEMSHGLDAIGSLFDGEGSLQPIISEQDQEAYDANTKCFADQYSRRRTSTHNTFVDGEKAKTEIVADNLGLAAALKALETKVGGPDKLTDDMLREFITAHTQFWATAQTAEEERRQVEEDVHPPMSARPDGTLSNLQDGNGIFVMDRLFKCRPGTPMRPKKPCSLL